MTYTLQQLAPGSYDVMLAGSPVAALVREVDRSGKKRGWSVELLDETPPAKRPAPFLAQRHAFETYAAALDWLRISGGGEYDAAQDRGEVASGRPKTLPGGNTSAATVSDLGLTSKAIHEARQIRDAERADDEGADSLDRERVTP